MDRVESGRHRAGDDPTGHVRPHATSGQRSREQRDVLLGPPEAAALLVDVEDRPERRRARRGVDRRSMARLGASKRAGTSADYESPHCPASTTGSASQPSGRVAWSGQVGDRDTGALVAREHDVELALPPPQHLLLAWSLDVVEHDGGPRRQSIPQDRQRRTRAVPIPASNAGGPSTTSRSMSALPNVASRPAANAAPSYQPPWLSARG